MNNESQQNNRIVDKIAIFILGFFNTATCVVGNYAVQNLLEYIMYEKYYFIFNWTGICIPLLSRLLCTFLVSVNVRYEITIIINLILFTVCLLACSILYNFWTIMTAIVVINFTTTFVDSSLLCYITKNRKPGLLKPWGLGVAVSLLGGAGFSYMCVRLIVPLFWTLISLFSYPIFYALFFFAVIYFSPASNFTGATTNENEEDSAGVESISTNEDGLKQPILDDLSEKPYEQDNSNASFDGESVRAAPVEDANEKICMFNMSFFKRSWWLILNTCFVFLLYFIIDGLIVLVGLKFEMDDVFIVPYLILCFQIGIFISFGSFYVLHIEKVWFFAICQAIVFALAAVQTFLHFTKNLIFYPLMFLFGLSCGFPFLSSIFSIMIDETKSTRQKELAISWYMFFLSLIFVLSKVFLYYFEKMYFKESE